MADEIEKRGRPSVYTPEIADEICQYLAEGLSLRAVCRKPGMPSEATVRGWAMNDLNGFFSQYSHARHMGYLAMGEELLDIADDGQNDFMDRLGKDGLVEKVPDHELVQRSRLRVETRKWLLAKALPKIYGDQLALTGPAGGPIQTEDVGDKELARRLALVLARGAHSKPEDDSGGE